MKAIDETEAHRNASFLTRRLTARRSRESLIMDSRFAHPERAKRADHAFIVGGGPQPNASRSCTSGTSRSSIALSIRPRS